MTELFCPNCGNNNLTPGATPFIAQHRALTSLKVENAIYFICSSCSHEIFDERLEGQIAQAYADAMNTRLKDGLREISSAGIGIRSYERILGLNADEISMLHSKLSDDMEIRGKFISILSAATFAVLAAESPRSLLIDYNEFLQTDRTRMRPKRTPVLFRSGEIDEEPPKNPIPDAKASRLYIGLDQPWHH